MMHLWLTFEGAVGVFPFFTLPVFPLEGGRSDFFGVKGLFPVSLLDWRREDKF